MNHDHAGGNRHHEQPGAMMEKIEGVDLVAVAARVEEEWLVAQAKKVGEQVNGILLNIRTWEREIREAQQKIAELTGKIAKAQGRFDKIRAGDWSVLSELKAKPVAEAEG